MLEYIQRVGSQHRKSLGQFFTHPEVARFMVHWVLGSGQKSLFDPAFGLGVFHEVVPGDLDIEFSACEVDPHIIEFWKQKNRGMLRVCHHRELLILLEQKACEYCVQSALYALSKISGS